MERYERQMMIPQIGKKGQDILQKTCVTVIGAGGLGSPVLTYLAEAGVGHIRCIDGDVVSLSNLNRQFLHEEVSIGREKAYSAAERLKQMNSTVHVEAVHARITEKNVTELIGNEKVVVDCVDNIATRLWVNEICLQKKIPLVEGGISGFYGFVTAIAPWCACLECMGYHKEMNRQIVPALGTTAGVIGALQANECLKILLGTGKPLYGRILQYDGLAGEFDEIEVEKSGTCRAHGSAEEIKNKELQND